jgi:hypothetical protein
MFISRMREREREITRSFIEKNLPHDSLFHLDLLRRQDNCQECQIQPLDKTIEAFKSDRDIKEEEKSLSQSDSTIQSSQVAD